MRNHTVKIDMTGQPRWLINLVGAALFIGFGIVMHGILLSVEYRWHKVLDVGPIAGYDSWHRAVLVDTPDRARLLRTGDPLIRVDKGMQVCVSERRLIARQWRRWRLELPGYCRNQPRYTVSPPALSTDPFAPAADPLKTRPWLNGSQVTG